MRLSTEAQAWLSATVQRVLARHPLGEAERAGIHYELMGHLHAAGERKAEEAGRAEITAGDLQAAVLEMGGEEALADAFVRPHAKPLQRAGLVKRTAAWVVDVIILFVGWWVLAGLAFLAVAVTLLPFGFASFPGRAPEPWDLMFDGPGPGFFGLGMFGLGVLLVLGYFAYLEGTKGATFGKKVFDLRVLRADGRAVTVREALVRNLVKVFPPLLLLDALFMVLFFSKEQQRVSDRIADTIVVEGPA